MKKMLNFGIVFAGMLIISLFSISANADVEPNDNLNSAENVNFGTISGSISSTDTEDNYKFSGITKDDVVFVNLTSAPVGTEISLYDGESGSYIGSKVGLGSKFVYCPNEETTQSLIVKISGSVGTYTFTAEKMLQNDANSGHDAPGERTAILPTIQPGNYNGYLADYDTEDWYSVNLPAGSYIYVNVYPSSSLSISVDLYDDSGYIHSESGNEVGKNVSLWYFSPEAANYKIGISFTGTYIGGYNFSIITAKQNDGNSGKDAGKILGSEIELSGSINGTYPGTFAGNDDEDWYIVNLTDGDAVTVNVKPSITDCISVDLYKILDTSTYDKGYTSSVNGDNVSLHSCYNTDGTPLKMQIRVSDFVYYGERNDYNITLQILHQNDGNSGKDAGENLASAVEIIKGNYSGYLEEEDNIDYYKFNVGAGCTINITLVAPTNMKLTATLFDSLNIERSIVSITSGGTRLISYLNSASAQVFYLKIEHDDYGSSPKPNSYTYIFELDITGGDNQPPSAYILPLPSNSCTNFTVSWNSPDPDTVKYTVQVRFGSNDWTDWLVNVTYKTAVYHGTNNTRYFFRVKACDSWGNWGSFTPNPDGDASTNVTCEGSSGNTSPSPVTLNAPSRITSKGFTLSWTQSTETDFYSYEIHISTMSGFTPSQTTKKVEFLYSTTTTHNLTNLKSNTMYYAKIKVTDNDGLFSISNEVYAKTLSAGNTGLCYTLFLVVGSFPAIIFLAWFNTNKNQK